ncbi:hypothetical protein GCM10009575_012940 [Streptomyces rhizosphaericus]|uniref:Uncharacterized protein n=1 Tax=Streptomyces rhizosphaericus TaxID=114699 RepID=A0ABN1P081_9ACTN
MLAVRRPATWPLRVGEFFNAQSLAGGECPGEPQQGRPGPREWLPTDPGARCRCLEEWTVVKSRWGLSEDPGEVAALTGPADGCRDARITYALAR